MPNSSNKLKFRIFADDTNVFYSHHDPQIVEKVMNEEFQNISKYCNTNKLSVNMKKTHYMIISSARKKVQPININGLEQKKYVRYLGIYIDQHLKWEPQIQHIHSKLSKNIGIINKIRYFIDLKLLRLLYYSLIYPYLHYGIISWGNTYKTKLDKLRTKQNTCIRRIFLLEIENQ